MVYKKYIHRIGTVGAAFALTAAFLATAMYAAPPDSFVKWTEPKEGAFSVEVPRGWKIVGGLSRPAPLDLREFVIALSPQKDALVQIGDPGVPMFTTVGAADQQLGYAEGQSRNILGTFTEVYRHFMSGAEFSRWYTENRLTEAFNNLRILDEKEAPQVSQNLTAGARKTALAGTIPVVSMGMVTFSGVDKDTGKRVGGAVMTTTTLTNANNGPYGSVWIAAPIVIASESQPNGEPTPESGKKLQAAMMRMLATRHENPVWLAKEQRRQTQVRLAAKKRDDAETARKLAQIKDAGERSRFIASHNSTLHDSSMNAYYRRQAMLDENHHQFLNYLRSEKDATDSNGDHLTVPNQ